MAGTILYRVTPEEQREIEETVVNWLIQRAIDKNIATSPDELVVRDLLPGTDLNGLSGEVWVQSLSAFQYVTVYSGKVPETKIMAIYGVKNKDPAPKTVAIKFAVGGGAAKVKDIWHLEHAWLNEDTAGFTKTVIKYEDGETFNIQFYGKESGEDGVILLGKVVEPKGEMITGE